MPRINPKLMELIDRESEYPKEVKEFVKMVIDHQVSFSETSNTYTEDFKKYLEKVITMKYPSEIDSNDTE